MTTFSCDRCKKKDLPSNKKYKGSAESDNYCINPVRVDLCERCYKDVTLVLRGRNIA